MPKVYEAIRDELLAREVGADEAKRRAAAIFVSQGKSKGARSTRAKALAKDRPPPKRGV
jgi:hypothetical protein